MKKRTVFAHPNGSAAQVVAHGQWQRSRNRRPAMSFRGIHNPRKAYAAAEEALRLGSVKELLTYEKIDGRTNIHINGDAGAEKAVLRAIVIASFELSRPAGLGFLHFDKSTKMTEDEADRFISLPPRHGDVVIEMDYVQGRQCKTVVWKKGPGHYLLNDHLFERDRGSIEPMLEKAKQIATGDSIPPGLSSTGFMFSGESLTMRLKEYGLTRRNENEGDWDFRKRVFPDLFEKDPGRALEFLMGASATEWEEMDKMLCSILLMKGKPGRRELADFAKGFGWDPAETRNRRAAANA
ncbi:MAG TPA: hypothetical protein VF817_05120 [Patescibacteria group bacterium]